MRPRYQTARLSWKMAAQSHSVWPVILNISLGNSEIHQLLSREHKVRVTDTTGKDVIIFPLSSVAFMFLPFNSDRTALDTTVIERIERLHQIHRQSYVIFLSSVMGAQELQTFMSLQERFFGANISFIPAHNSMEALDCMLSIAKATCKSVSGVIQERLKKLRDSTISDSVVLNILHKVGLSSHVQCFVLQHGCKSLAKIAQATGEELIDCSLDLQTAQKIREFFDKDTIPI